MSIVRLAALASLVRHQDLTRNMPSLLSFVSPLPQKLD